DELVRADRVGAIVDGLSLESAADAVELTGSWAKAAAVSAQTLVTLPAERPSEEELSLSVGGSPAETDLGGLSVSVAPTDPDAESTEVRVRVAGEEETDGAGVTGVLLTVS